MNKNRCHHFLLHSALLLGGVFCAGAKLAHAGVIQGTGTSPNATQLGATDAVRFQMAESGPGHVLVVPYFTAQNGQMSVLHLVNTDGQNAKVVKIRFRGASNADTLLDFVVLLSPSDVWTGAVSAGPDGRAQITSADNSCTYPSIQPGQAQPFSTARLNPGWSSQVAASNTREGYVEVIAMADIPIQASSFSGISSPRSALFNAINHIAGVAPCTQAVLNAALLTDVSSEAAAAARGFATPTGGLMATWYIIDVPGSTTFSGTATAFTAVNSSGQPARGNYVLFPQSSETVLQPERFTADPLLVSAGLAGRTKTSDGVLGQLTQAPVLQARFSDLPDLSTPYYLAASAVNARRTAGDFTQTLAVTSIKNQFSTEASISAKTDWVFSMPTMRYSVAYDYAAIGSTSPTVYSPISPKDSNTQYFSQADVHFTTGNIAADSSGTRLLTAFSGGQYFDREKGGGSLRCMFMCPHQPLTALLGMVTVRAFVDDGRSALSASATRQTIKSSDGPPLTQGWFDAPAWVPNTNVGLPILGASFIKLTNPSAQPGVAGNYGITWPHGYTR